MALLFQCVFVRANVISGISNIHQCSKEKRYKSFKEQFSECRFDMTERHFHRKSQDLHNHLRKIKWRSSPLKSKYLEHFSVENWQKLDTNEKLSHTLNVCYACSENHREVLDFIPKVRSNVSRKDKRPVPIAIPSIPTPDSAKQKTPKYQIQVAAGAFRELSETWEATYQTPFTEVIRKVPEAKLTPRKSKVEKQKSKRDIVRKCKKGLEGMWSKDNRDVETFYGTRQSGSAFDKQRSSLHLETRERAAKRAGKMKSLWKSDPKVLTFSRNLEIFPFSNILQSNIFNNFLNIVFLV